jgi:hypothetical protein
MPHVTVLRLIGLALGVCPKLGISLARICLLAVAYISLVAYAISSIQLHPCPQACDTARQYTDN